MKVLFNCHLPFMLTHGGTPAQVQLTKTALDQLGVKADYLRWWDASQTADVVHHFGVMPPGLVQLAQARGWKVVNTVPFSQTCNRSRWALLLRRVCIRSALKAPIGPYLKALLPWRAFHLPDQMVVGLHAERALLEHVYGVPGDRISVVPLGLSDGFLSSPPALRNEQHLLCAGSICPAKNSLALARLAVAAKVPVLFLGKPLEPDGDYWKAFQDCVDGRYVRLHPHVDSQEGMIALLRAARGCVLMSRFENWCLAAHEAAACGLPLLLPDQRWARERFGDQAHYFPRRGRRAAMAALREFYEKAPHLPSPAVRLYSWRDVAGSLQEIYTRVTTGGQSPGSPGHSRPSRSTADR